MKQIFLLITVLLTFSLCVDEVRDLPNYPYKGQMYSGYLTLKDPRKNLHYLFLESQNNPREDPLVLWLNGGPGCSSLLGWAQEHGPYIFPDSSTEFVHNPHSWNRKT